MKKAEYNHREGIKLPNDEEIGKQIRYRKYQYVGVLDVDVVKEKLGKDDLRKIKKILQSKLMLPLRYLLKI